MASERTMANDDRKQTIRFFTEEELDALEETDPDMAYRIARAQAIAARDRLAPTQASETGPPDRAAVERAIEDVRRILQRDGGDIELIGIDGTRVQVRMKGACAGCPNSVLDLRHVVEKIVCAVPGVSSVVNTF